MQLTNAQLIELANLLLACDAIRDRGIRGDVLAFLPDNVRGALPRRDQDRADVINIARTCANYPGALDALLEGVRCFDAGSAPLQALEAFWHGLAGAAPNVPGQPLPANPQQLEASLCRIDFTQAIETFEVALRDMGTTGGAALFLLQNSYAMGSRWLMQRIDGRLKEVTYSISIDTKPIGFEPGMHHDEQGLLRRLGEWFAVHDHGDDRDHYMTSLIEAICLSIHSKKVILLELSGWHHAEERLFAWFVEHFWSRMVDALAIASQDLYGVYVVAVLVTNTQIPPETLTPHLCPDGRFDSKRITCLPLEPWSVDDIRIWLSRSSRLATSPRRVIDREAERIYASSINGTPRLVADLLRDTYAP
ncbi:hypothetical protein EYB53_021560 [Candidatus Chloroploca sp. M-50]|uniref:Uncharacterized protein n=1 Tax=Candidatus Chloroploca mongolica TaxID=2528176 RepID=A0ABS4DFV3_9CHLR|nr:hypothetical protein [Candidatus Chloroploca mongolica]MBP1468313.1 hypothetical protein [Candidatus Chloroploca mongolica]